MPKERVERDEEDLVRLYLTDIGQYPLLTKDDEVRLAKAIEGGTAAIDELEKAMSLRKGGDSFDWFVLAMAHCRLGDRDKARRWFERAV